MSDYIYTSKKQDVENITDSLISIYTTTPPVTIRYQGAWGNLAVTNNQYHGFQPYENAKHLMILIGGPVLYFRNNDFLAKEDSNEATAAIYRRWITENKIQWDEDLSGPFTILLISKLNNAVSVVTDLLAFIQIYSCSKSNDLFLSTHVDVLAKVAEETSCFDQVSLADFFLNDAITYPYTAYENIYQLAPSSNFTFNYLTKTPIIQSYWSPSEINSYKDLNEAAIALREGINGYVTRITENMVDVAQFISGGEDSRSISGMLPQRLNRDAFVFLDGMNREGIIAKRVADIYGANFNVGYRSPTHYLEILAEARKLVGSGHQYIHAHSLGFNRTYELAKYSAVFGGYLSDSLLKSPFTRKLRGIGRVPFFPEFFLNGENRTVPISSRVIDKSILEKINQRRKERFKQVQIERPTTAHEWFVLRPATMRVAIPNLYTNRRLFRSYEPFMCKEAVKVSAAVPTDWKLNRRLFNRAMKPSLFKSKWLLHADGRLPYFSWWINIPLQFGVWLCRLIAKRLGIIKGNQGPWGDWLHTVKSSEWRKMVEECKCSKVPVNFLRKDTTVESVLLSSEISAIKKCNLMQTIYPTDL